jgi:EAL domain-containing protein (putative c-di-GMP-specific phosphodiesterase class I)
MEELTAQLLVQALEQMRDWRESGHLFSISLNVSTTSLSDLNLPDTLSDIVSGYGFQNDAVMIELTESAMTEERVETLDILTRLRMKGFALSMDDFGTGYSTLLELVRLPFNEIKIDPRFIDQIGVRRESGIVIRTAIGLAHGLGMTVCAEGVESPETLDFLRGAGCDAAQGRAIQEPVSGSDLMTYLKTRGPASAPSG